MIFISEKTPPPPNISPSTISKPADAQQVPISDPKISNHAQWTVSLLFCCPYYFVLTKQNTLIWKKGKGIVFWKIIFTITYRSQQFSNTGVGYLGVFFSALKMTKCQTLRKF